MSMQEGVSSIETRSYESILQKLIRLSYIM